MSFADQLKEEEKNNIVNTLERVFDHPQVGRKAKKLLMEFDSNMKFPEVELEDRVEKEASEREKALLERIDKLESNRDRDDIKTKLEKEEQEILSAGIVTQEQLPDVKKLMVEQGITNLKTAADYYRLMRQAVIPTGDHSTKEPTALPKDKELWEDPRAWSNKMALKVIAENAKKRQNQELV